MNAVHQTFAPFLRAACPIPPMPSEAQAEAIDREMLADKLNDGYTKRNDAAAMALQVKHGSAT